MTVADSELAIARGDVEGALKKLRKVPAESPHYTKVGGQCVGGWWGQAEQVRGCCRAGRLRDGMKRRQ